MSSVEITAQHFNKSSSQAENTVWEDIQIFFFNSSLGGDKGFLDQQSALNTFKMIIFDYIFFFSWTKTTSRNMDIVCIVWGC